MPAYKVKWHTCPRDPRSSRWWVLNGVITATSAALEDWVGGDHKALVRHLSRRHYTITLLNPREHVPPTLKYHKQLKANVDALLQLIAKE